MPIVVYQLYIHRTKRRTAPQQLLPYAEALIPLRGLDRVNLLSETLGWGFKHNLKEGLVVNGFTVLTLQNRRCPTCLLEVKSWYNMTERP